MHFTTLLLILPLAQACMRAKGSWNYGLDNRVNIELHDDGKRTCWLNCQWDGESRLYPQCMDGYAAWIERSWNQAPIVAYHRHGQDFRFRMDQAVEERPGRFGRFKHFDFVANIWGC